MKGLKSLSARAVVGFIFRYVFAVLFLGFVFLLPILALAQGDASAAPVDPASAVGQLLTAMQGKHWIVVVGLVLSLLTYGVRTWIVPGWKWAQTDRGGAILGMIVSAIGVVGASLATGTTSLWTIVDALAADLLSAGAFNRWKKIRTPAPPAVVALPPSPPSSR